MPELDLSITFTVIIAISAIISPIFVALINNKHQINLRKLELEYSHKMKEIEERQRSYERYVIQEIKVLYEFLSSIGYVSHHLVQSSIERYGSLYPLVYARANSDLQKSLIQFDSEIRSNERLKASKLVAPITVSIKAMIEDIESKYKQ